MTRPLFHRRCHDPARAPVATIHNGSAELVPVEGPLNHLRNALQLVRALLDFGEMVVGTEAAVLVPVGELNAIQRRVEAAIGLLELDGAACCLACGGTILPATIGGVPRGTCHCKR